MIDTQTLMVGAGVAGLAAAWQQVKGVLSYASSVLVVRARISPEVGFDVVRHLKRRWKPLPSGIFTFYGKSYEFKKEGTWKTIPFHVLNGTSVMYREGCIVILSDDNGGIKLTSLRGMIDFKKLISEALDDEIEANRVIAQANPVSGWNIRRRGFFVKHVIGADKTLGIAMPRRKYSSDNDDPIVAETHAGNVNTPSASAYDRFYHPDMDESFKYAREDWANTEETYDPFARLFYSDEVMRHAHEAIQWLDMREWYSKRMIPWRRGWLLYGIGGTGKSSLARAIADKMGAGLYWYHLATLSDQEFINRWKSMQTPCVALFEDFDTVFHGRDNVTEHKSLTFDVILNCLSSVIDNYGVFTIITTNHIDKIDPALGVVADKGDGRISTRPGRIDTVIELGLADEKCRRGLASTILADWSDIIEATVKESEGYTPTQVQELCVQKAFHILANKEN